MADTWGRGVGAALLLGDPMAYSQGAEIRNTFGSGGAPIPGPFPGPALGNLLMLDVRRGHKSPFVPYLAFLLAVPRL